MLFLFGLVSRPAFFDRFMSRLFDARDSKIKFFAKTVLQKSIDCLLKSFVMSFGVGLCCFLGALGLVFVLFC